MRVPGVHEQLLIYHIYVIEIAGPLPAVSRQDYYRKEYDSVCEGAEGHGVARYSEISIHVQVAAEDGCDDAAHCICRVEYTCGFIVYCP